MVLGLDPTPQDLWQITVTVYVCANYQYAGYGVYIGQFYVGGMLYADDIIRVCHSVTAMQKMLDICSQLAQLLDFSFNTVKSVALRIGPRYKYECSPLFLNGSALSYEYL